MRQGEVNGRTWHELARLGAPVGRRLLWQALLEKTEAPERFAGGLLGAQVLDHDACTVLRRIVPAQGAPYFEWVRHEVHRARVEARRSGQTWSRAQAVLDTPEGRVLVYLVDDPAAAQAEGAIDAAHARAVLERLLQAARSMDGVPVESAGPA